MGWLVRDCRAKGIITWDFHCGPCMIHISISDLFYMLEFDISTLSVLYNKDVYPTSSIIWLTTFPSNILKSHQTT